MLLALGLYFVLLSTYPTVSCEMVSTRHSSTALSANRRRVQRLCPVGAGVQTRAVSAARPGPDCRYSIHQHPERLTHYLIVMEPACDTWIFETAHAAGLNLTHFAPPPPYRPSSS